MGKARQSLISGVLALAVVVGMTSVGAAGAASSKTSAHKARPVVVGFECSCSGAEASSIAIQEDIIKAWASYQNSRGGLHGHKVKIVVADDALNPGTSLSQVTHMVEQDHAAVILDATDVDSAWSSFVEQHHIPVVTVNLSSTLAYSNPFFFPIGQTSDAWPSSIATAAKKSKVTNLGSVYCAEAAICAQLAPPIKKAAQGLGMTSNFATSISASAPNYAAPCLAAKQAGANGMFVGQASQVVVSFAKNCAQQGYKPKFIALFTAISQQFLSTSALAGFAGIESNLPASVKTNAAVRTMDKALKRYAPSVLTSPNFSPGDTTVWTSGLLLAAIAKTLPAKGSVTPANVLKGLYSLHNETLGGMAPPLTYHKGQATAVDCWFYLSVKKHKFTMPFGTKPICPAPASSKGK